MRSFDRHALGSCLLLSLALTVSGVVATACSGDGAGDIDRSENAGGELQDLGIASAVAFPELSELDRLSSGSTIGPYWFTETFLGKRLAEAESTVGRLVREEIASRQALGRRISEGSAGSRLKDALGRDRPAAEAAFTVLAVDLGLLFQTVTPEARAALERLVALVPPADVPADFAPCAALAPGTACPLDDAKLLAEADLQLTARLGAAGLEPSDARAFLAVAAVNLSRHAMLDAYSSRYRTVSTKVRAKLAEEAWTHGCSTASLGRYVVSETGGKLYPPISTECPAGPRPDRPDLRKLMRAAHERVVGVDERLAALPYDVIGGIGSMQSLNLLRRNDILEALDRLSPEQGRSSPWSELFDDLAGYMRERLARMERDVVERELAAAYATGAPSDAALAPSLQKSLDLAREYVTTASLLIGTRDRSVNLLNQQAQACFEREAIDNVLSSLRRQISPNGWLESERKDLRERATLAAGITAEQLDVLDRRLAVEKSQLAASAKASTEATKTAITSLLGSTTEKRADLERRLDAVSAQETALAASAAALETTSKRVEVKLAAFRAQIEGGPSPDQTLLDLVGSIERRFKGEDGRIARRRADAEAMKSFLDQLSSGASAAEVEHAWKSLCVVAPTPPVGASERVRSPELVRFCADATTHLGIREIALVLRRVADPSETWNEADLTTAKEKACALNVEGGIGREFVANFCVSASRYLRLAEIAAARKAFDGALGGNDANGDAAVGKLSGVCSASTPIESAEEERLCPAVVEYGALDTLVSWTQGTTDTCATTIPGTELAAGYCAARQVAGDAAEILAEAAAAIPSFDRLGAAAFASGSDPIDDVALGNLCAGTGRSRADLCAAGKRHDALSKVYGELRAATSGNPLRKEGGQPVGSYVCASAGSVPEAAQACSIWKAYAAAAYMTQDGSPAMTIAAYFKELRDTLPAPEHRQMVRPDINCVCAVPHADVYAVDSSLQSLCSEAQAGRQYWLYNIEQAAGVPDDQLQVRVRGMGPFAERMDTQRAKLSDWMANGYGREMAAVEARVSEGLDAAAAELRRAKGALNDSGDTMATEKTRVGNQAAARKQAVLALIKHALGGTASSLEVDRIAVVTRAAALQDTLAQVRTNLDYLQAAALLETVNAAQRNGLELDQFLLQQAVIASGLEDHLASLKTELTAISGQTSVLAVERKAIGEARSLLDRLHIDMKQRLENQDAATQESLAVVSGAYDALHGTEHKQAEFAHAAASLEKRIVEAQFHQQKSRIQQEIDGLEPRRRYWDKLCTDSVDFGLPKGELDLLIRGTLDRADRQLQIVVRGLGFLAEKSGSRDGGALAQARDQLIDARFRASEVARHQILSALVPRTAELFSNVTSTVASASFKHNPLFVPLYPVDRTATAATHPLRRYYRYLDLKARGISGATPLPTREEIASLRARCVSDAAHPACATYVACLESPIDPPSDDAFRDCDAEFEELVLKAELTKRPLSTLELSQCFADRIVQAVELVDAELESSAGEGQRFAWSAYEGPVETPTTIDVLGGSKRFASWYGSRLRASAAIADEHPTLADRAQREAHRAWAARKFLMLLKHHEDMTCALNVTGAAASCPKLAGTLPTGATVTGSFPLSIGVDTADFIERSHVIGIRLVPRIVRQPLDAQLPYTFKVTGIPLVGTRGGDLLLGTPRSTSGGSASVPDEPVQVLSGTTLDIDSFYSSVGAWPEALGQPDAEWDASDALARASVERVKPFLGANAVLPRLKIDLGRRRRFSASNAYFGGLDLRLDFVSVGEPEDAAGALYARPDGSIQYPTSSLADELLSNLYVADEDEKWFSDDERLFGVFGWLTGGEDGPASCKRLAFGPTP